MAQDGPAWAEIAQRYGWSQQSVDRLLGRYGSLLGELLELAGDRPLDLPGVSYLPCAAAPHPMLDCISQITTFYVFAERFAFDLGLDPDSPKLLKKVTETI